MKTNRKIRGLLMLLFCFINIGLIYYFNARGLFLKINNDANAFLEIANQISQGFGIGKNIWWPPLYPYLLSLIIPFKFGLVFLSIIQTLLYFCCFVIFYKILVDFGKKKNRFFYPLVLMFLPSGIIISKIPLADTFFLFFYLSHIYFLFKFVKFPTYSRLLLSILLLVASTFTKPTTLYLHLLEYTFIFFILYKAKSLNLRKFIIGIILSLLIPSMFYCAWSFRNLTRYKIYTFANVKNYNLLIHNFVHIYPYVKLLTQDNRFAYNARIGDELKSEEANRIRQFLIHDYMDNYLLNNYNLNPRNINWNDKVFYMGQAGLSFIKQYFYIYLPIHYVKSLKLFFPNNWEMMRLLVNPSSKKIIFFTDFFAGLLIIWLFLKNLRNFINFNSHLTAAHTVSILLLINIFYMMSVIGPTAIDDSGRFSFVFMFPVFMFIGINNTAKPKISKNNLFQERKTSTVRLRKKTLPINPALRERRGSSK